MKLYFTTFYVDETKIKRFESFKVETKEVDLFKNRLFINTHKKYCVFADELNKIILNFNYDISSKYYYVKFYSLKKYSDE